MKNYFWLILLCVVLFSGCVVKEKYSAKDNPPPPRGVFADLSDLSKDAPDSLTYTIIKLNNPKMYPLLDSIIKMKNECLFSKKEQPYYFLFYFLEENQEINFTIKGIQITQFFYPISSQFFLFSYLKYCFEYEGEWFWGMVGVQDSTNFFSFTDKKKSFNIRYPFIYDYNAVIPAGSHHNSASIEARYKGDNFHIFWTVHCAPVEVLYYTPAQNEPLSEIARKYLTTEKIIRQLNPDLTIPDIVPRRRTIRVQ